MWAYKQEMGYEMCNLLWPMVGRDKAPHRAEVLRLGRVARQCMGQLGGWWKQICQQIYQPICQQVPETEDKSAEADTQKQRERQRKGQKRKGECQRDGLTFPERGPRVCAVANHGLFKICAFLQFSTQSVCFHDNGLFQQWGTGVGGAFAQSISRPLYYARRDQAFDCESRPGKWTPGHKEPAPSNQISWSSKEASDGGYGPAAISPGLMGESYFCWNSVVGKTIGRVSKTPSRPDRTGCPYVYRDYGNQQAYTAVEQSGGGWPCSSIATGQCGSRRHGRRVCRQRGRTSEATSARRPEKLCQFAWVGLGTSQSYRDSRGRWSQRGRCREETQETQIYGAICYSFLQVVSAGRDKEVHRNSLHVAKVKESHASTVEAYWITTLSSGAACGSWDDDTLLTWKHSIIFEPRFVSPFQATLNALSLQWEVGKEVGFKFALRTSTRVVHPFPGVLLTSQRPRPYRPIRHVRFEDHIDVLLGNEDDLNMYCMRATHSMFQNWPLKPWKKRRPRFRILWSASPSSLDPLSELAVLNRQRVHVKETGLSSDEHSSMQVSTFKHDVHSEPNSNLLNALSGPHGPPQGYQEHPDDIDLSSGDRESSSSDTQSNMVEVHPPSITDSRQEVVMFHLQDEPIRAFLEWKDYDSMIQEIGYHYSVNPDAVVDAYEINVPLRGIPDEAVPIIVHLFPDIGVDQFAKAVLVLFDIELHGHRSEAHFKTGPATRRFVLPVPEWSDRATILFLANVALYCHLEGGRCLVWHDEFRWPDYDQDQRRIANGDYIRIAIPPTQRFDCSTAQTLLWTQDGLSDQEILHQAADQDAQTGYSPSLLSETEVRALARQESSSDESDLLNAMQISNSQVGTPISDRSSEWSPSFADWNLDLQRIVEAVVREHCLDDPIELRVYTWFVDCQTHSACLRPKIA